jgi:protocatechuate 3,4-dioxygenase beta subunit
MPLRALVCLLALSTAAAAQSAADPCATATSSAILVSEDEPGERLVVSGTVFQPDGVTPAPGVIVYAYQTDATGVYNTQRNAPPRLRGWVRTDAQGRYRFTTIIPGSYPSRRQPAHIHLQLWDGGYEWQWSEDILFAADPLLRDEERRRSESLGRFAFVKTPAREASGMSAVTHDIRLKAYGARAEESIRHGMRACGLQM